jgi:hypothetical protein
MIEEEIPPRLATPELRAQLGALALSRWSAIITRFGEATYTPGQALDLVVDEPCVIRTPSSIGPAFAESCEGIPVACFIRLADGLRTGAFIVDGPDGPSRKIVPCSGFVESATATADGIVAVLAILARRLHEDLVDLAARDVLDHADLCLSHRVTCSIRRSAWGLAVADITSATARYLSLTSLSHVPGCRILRQLGPDEPLGPQDLEPVERRHLPAIIGGDVVAEIGDAALSPGQIGTPQLAPGAAAAAFVNQTNSLVPVVGTSEEVVWSGTATTDASGVVDLQATVLHRSNTVGVHSVLFRIRRGSIGGAVVSQPCAPDTVDTVILMASVLGIDTSPSAGSTTYVITAQSASGSTTIGTCTMKAVNHRPV